MIRIDSGNPGSEEPFTNLEPVVALLLRHGNSYHGGREGFQRDPHGGWICFLEAPIDFELLRQEFEFSPDIDASEEKDGILDRRTWCLISGPGERERSIVVPARPA
jgi:hypothetical protein